MVRRLIKLKALTTSHIIICAALLVSSMSLFQVKYVEVGGGRLIATSNYNYAITSDVLKAKNWRTVSVNGDDVLIFTLTGGKLVNTKATLNPADKLLIESTRDRMSESEGGFSQIMSSGGGPGGSMMMSSSNGNMGSSSTSFSSSGGVSTSMSSGSGMGGSSFQINDMKVNMKDESNFSVSKMSLPFGWSQVFVNEDLVTLVFKDGRVEMRPTTSLEVGQREAVEKLRREAVEMQKAQAKQMSDTMSNSMNMISNVFNGIMGNFPQAQDSGASAAAGGFPFGNGGAFAFAGR